MSVPDPARHEPHGVSDSESELLISGKKKRSARKSKGVPADTPPAAPPVTIAPTHQLSAAPVVVTQDSKEMTEMRAMFAEIKGLTEKNAAYVELMAKNEQARLTAVPVASVTQAPPDMVSKKVDNVEQPDVELDNTVFQDNGDVEAWAVFNNQSETGWQTEEEGEDDEYYIDDSVFVSEPKPRTVREAQAACAAMPVAGTSATADKTSATAAPGRLRPVYTLSENLREGVMHAELREIYKKIRKPTNARIEVDNDLAGAIAHYYAFSKPKKALNDLARQYTGIKNIPEARVQKLNEEIRFVDARKHAEDSMLCATKGVVAALTAVAPTVALILSRGKGDHELDEQALKMLDVVKILVLTHSQLTGDRLLNVKKVVNSFLGKEVIKPKTDAYGEKELPTDNLLGEDLAEKNKKIIKSARASDTVMSTSLAPRKWRRPNEYYQRSFQSSFRPRGQWNLRGRMVTGRGMPYNWNARPGMQSRFNRLSSGYGANHSQQNNPRMTRGRGAPAPQRGFQK